jgi:uncharacterized membrane protein
MSGNSERRLRTGLFVSLLFNAFLLGALGVTLLVGWRTLDGWSGWSPDSSRGYAGLTAAEREGLREALRTAAPTVGPLLRDARAARRQVREIFAAADLDAAAASVALAQVREAESRLKVEIDRVLLGYAAGLPPDRRIFIADALRPGRRAFDGVDAPPSR